MFIMFIHWITEYQNTWKETGRIEKK
jgi:hypothetical protein